jgi:glucokinase
MLVAMIDGETVGFAVAQHNNSLSLENVWRGKTADYPTFIDAFQHYLRTNGLQPSDYAFAIAVAGVPRGDIISFANCKWFVSVSGLRAFLRSQPLILNDFAATAWSLTAISRTCLLPVGARQPGAIGPGTFLVVGTGCGLGAATLHITAGGEVVVLESEGGHSSFAPQSAADDAIMPHLRRQFGHVSFERVVSEPGLQTVYRALAARDGKTGDAPDPARILAAARQRTDLLAVETMKVFTRTLGSFVGNAALTVGSWDGIFLTGEMLHRVLPTLTQEDFRATFTGKGRLAKLLENVPVAFVNSPDTRLLGAAAALQAQLREQEAAAAVQLRPAVGQ